MPAPTPEDRLAAEAPRASPPLRPLWRFRRRRRADIGRWPFTIGFCATASVTIAALSIAEREALAGGDWATVALIGLAVLPWVVDLLLLEVPPWVFAPVVMVPVAVLHDPTGFDPLPLLFAVLALDMGLWLGIRRSSPVIVASAAILLLRWPDDATGDPEWLGRPLVAIAAAWILGLVLHSQLQRINRLRDSRAEAIDRTAAVRAQLGDVLADLSAGRSALDAGDLTEARRHLLAAERAAASHHRES